MSPLHFISLSGRVVRVVLYVVAAGLVVFFALTRTEVGREGLRRQLEREFARSFDGELEIRELRGNLLNRLSAGDVVLRDSSGHTLLSVDSVVVHPSWRDLFDRTISTGSVTLIGPEIHLRKAEDGSWNVAAFLGQRNPTESAANPWSFRATRVRVLNGRIVTENPGDLPSPVASGAVFDYSNADLRGIHGRAVVDWGSDLKLIDILELDGRLPAVGLDIKGLRGQIVREDRKLSLNETHLNVGNSTIHLNGSISSIDQWREHPENVMVELDINESIVDASELARLLPILPLRDVVATSMKLQGALSGLVVEDLVVSRGSSVLSAEGTLLGLPDSIDYEVALRPTSITWRDLRSVWPTTTVPNFDHLGTVDLTGYSDGIVRLEGGTRLDGSVDLKIESPAGIVLTEGTIGVGSGVPLRIEGAVEASNFNVGMVLKRADLVSALNGRLDVDLAGADLDDASGKLRLGLSGSLFASRAIDTMHVELDGSLDDFQGSLATVTDLGAAYAKGSARFSSDHATYRLDGRTVGLDVGRITLSDSLATSLNSSFSVTGSGRSWKTFDGDVSVSFDSSRVTYADHTRLVSPHETRLSIRQLGSENPRIEVGGDVLEVMVIGDIALSPFIELARAWTTAARSSIERERSKSYRNEPPRSAGVDPDRLDGYVTSVSDVLAEHGLEAQHLELQGRILRSDLLSTLLPGLPDLRTNASVTAELYASADQLSMVVDLSADSLEVGGTHSDNVRANLSLATGSMQSMLASLTAEVTVESSVTLAGGQAFFSPKLTAEMQEKQLNLRADAHAEGAVKPFHLVAQMNLTDERNQLTIQELQLAARDQTWTNPESSIIDLYGDATVVRGIRLKRTSLDASSPEHFYVEGTLSKSPRDTLFVETDDIRLEHVASMLAIDQPIRGSIHGRLALTGFGRQPELTGDVQVARLTFENRRLGVMNVSSRYIPGSPNVALSLDLRPESTAGSGLIVHDNRLSLDGTFRLPGGVTASGARDKGSLDLTLDIERADAFFFEYIFRNDVSNVKGHLTGRGHIGGDFSAPLFEAQLALQEGDFRVPEFNLKYSASGPIRVDEAGIHLDEVRLSDTRGGEAVIDGSVLFNDYRYFSFDLRGMLTDLRIMNVSQSKDLPFYGDIWASGDVSLTGPLSSAMLQSDNAVTGKDSDLYIPITASAETSDAGFIVFADSAGRLPDLASLTQRRGVLADRPEGERPFLDGLEMDLNITAPEGSTVHLVIDPLLGDVINAVGSGQMQLVRAEGDFFTFGTFDVSSGDYLFTAGEVFFRRFLIDNGTITWDGDPLDAMLDIAASYRTRASPEGLGVNTVQEYIPLIIQMNVGGRVSTPSVDLALAVDRDDRGMLGGYESSIEAQLNQPEHVAQYATSVLLTNSFLLTTSAQSQLSNTRNQLAFNSLSQLVASQLNRYLNYALPNVDLNLGVQGESTQDLDVTYGVALRLLDERLVIRGEGIYQSDQLQRTQQGVLDEFVVEVRLNPRVSVEVFYRREGDPLDVQSLNTSTTGAGVSYQTEFPTWRRLIDRLFGWLVSTDEEEAEEEVVAGAGG